MPKELRLSEHFVSPQGEGPRTGILTQFVRFAGCNMRCPGWPCDTQYAIDPAIWRHDSYKRDPDALAADVLAQTKETGSVMVNLTGGEPFMQDHDLLEQFIARLDGSYTIECFSNGSYLYPYWAIQRINFVLDWKLGGSGEADTAWENRYTNVKQLWAKDSVKFVVASIEDLHEARKIWNGIHEHTAAEFWVGAAWAKYENADIVEFVKEFKLPWRLNVQLHNYVYEPQERGR
jgi:7-carboxy-7-deazaguanine synthase